MDATGQRLLNATTAIRQFRFRASIDDCDEQLAVANHFRHLLIQLKYLAKYLPEPLRSELQAVDFDERIFSDASDAHSRVVAMLDDLDDVARAGAARNQQRERAIPNPVAVMVGNVLGAYYYNHRAIDRLFAEKGAPGDPPEGNCADKVTAWLKRVSADPSLDSMRMLGAVLEEFMEVESTRSLRSAEALQDARKSVVELLERHGLRYRRGGLVSAAGAAAPTRSLQEILRLRDLSALDVEFERALENVERDPPAAVTSACAIVEALCKVYIEDERLELPNEQTVKPLWKTVQKHLGLDPAEIADDDLKRILGGLTSVVDGLGAFRTHVGSAHGRGRLAYRPAARHARLALHSAHSLVAFVLETWDARAAQRAAAALKAPPV